MRRSLSAVSIVAVLAMFPSVASAKNSNDIVQIGRSIVVEPGENAGDVVCIACSILVRGQTAGDVVAVLGSVHIESGAQIAGDTVAIAGSIRLDTGAHIGGDIVAVVGRLRRDPGATVGGDATAMDGAGWVVLIFIVPLLILGGIVALIIWLIQRSRRPSPVPIYPSPTPNIRS
jgi:hypothetical protein